MDYDRDGDGMPTTSSPFDHHDHTHHDWSLSWSSSWYSSIDTIVGIKLPFPCCRFSDLPERVIVELFPFQFPHSICIPFQLISAGIKILWHKNILMVKIAINLYVQKQSWTKDLSKNVSAPTEPTLLASDDELNGYNGKKCQRILIFKDKW